MNIVTKVNEWQLIRRELKSETIGFIHTMGNLHAGHMSLCNRSQSENDLTVAAIFVNPKQFNQLADFELYPRTLEQDKMLLVDAKIDYLLLFSENEIYNDAYEVKVSETNLSTVLEGEFRPGHFSGMMTVVLKYLNLVQPNRAYYGEKDFQQLLLIKKMAAALFLPYEIVGCETVRAGDGLALSSRNARLTDEQKTKAALFAQLLQSDLNEEEVKQKLDMLGFKVEYIIQQWGRRLGAVWLDQVRLIDNVIKI